MIPGGNPAAGPRKEGRPIVALHQITAPSAFTGYGPGSQNTAPALVFLAGVAYLDDEQPGADGVLAYCRRHGFTVADADAVPADHAARVAAMRGEQVQRTGLARDAQGTREVEPSSPFSSNH
jgi:hypothetical protein